MVKEAKEQPDDVALKAFMDAAAERSPAWLKSIILATTPVLIIVARLSNQAAPYVALAYEKTLQAYEQIKPYSPELILPMLIGLVMMLFGGYFMTIIAVVEAYRICGWQGTADGLKTLWRSFVLLKKKNDEDNQEDNDGNGKADVMEIPRNQLVTRKLRLFLQHSDPKDLNAALTSIYSGLVAMLAVLKMQFARTISLGAAIGDMIIKPVNHLRPQISNAVPAEYHKWIDVAISYFCKAAGVSIAWALQRYLAAVHSAFRGATIFTQAFAVYTAKLGYKQLSEGYFDEVFAGVCAVIGVYYQISSGFNMPILLSMPLFPFLAIENLLSWVVAYGA